MFTQEQKLAIIELNRRKGLRDLYFFNRHILDYGEMQEQPHRLMCDSVITGGLKQLHLWPRGHFKSSMITVGYTLQRIAENPNIRILIANVTLTNAKSFLREIKGHLEKNKEFQLIYGNHVSRDEKWTETEIISSKRTKNLKEPTVMVAGVGQSLTGMHFDLILGDDLVNYDTVNTPEQIAKTARWYGDAMSLLEPGGQVILIGTRYHFGDLYGGIIEKMAEDYHPQIHAAIKDGEILFPARFTQKVLDDIKREQGSFMFSAQYLNNPVDDEHAKFKRADFRYYEPDILKGLKLYTTMTIDRAYSLAKTADFTGITIRSKDLNGNWYVRYAKRHKDSETGIIKSIFELKDYYKVDKVGVEQLAFVNTLKPHLDDEMRRRTSFFKVVELRGKTSKIARIESLVPLFESHSIYFIEKEMTDLEDELIRFPSAEHDDLCFVAGTNILTDKGYVPIERVKKDDLVVTRFGFQPVLESCSTGLRDVVTNIGLTGTPNHPVFIKGGIKELQYVEATDTIYIWNEKQSCIVESNIIGTHNQNEDSIDSTIGVIQNTESHQKHFIDRFTRIILEKYQKVLSFITKMVIRIITNQRILNVYQTQIMLDYIQMRNIELNFQEKISKKSEKRQNFGTLLLKELLGIKNKLLEVLLLVRENQPVLVAGNYSPQDQYKMLLPVQSPVDSDILIGRKKDIVYNLKIANHPEYIANGILVHNCDALAYHNYDEMKGEVIDDYFDDAPVYQPLFGKSGY